jgi:osmoprotectant transport system permease protein
VRQFHLALVGALMVTALALILDAALAYAVWLSVPGTGRLSAVGRRMPQPFISDEVAVESRPRSTSQSSFSPRSERGDASHTV